MIQLEGTGKTIGWNEVNDVVFAETDKSGHIAGARVNRHTRCCMVVAVLAECDTSKYDDSLYKFFQQ